MSKTITLADEHALLSEALLFEQPIMGNSLTVICAGHFMLMPNQTKDKLVPSFELNNEVVGIFSPYTWELGCKLASQLISENRGTTKISLIINDWQLVPKNSLDDSGKTNPYRENFYSEFKSVPTTYAKILKDYNLSVEENMYHPKENQFYFKETSLRKKFSRQHSKYKLAVCDGISCSPDNGAISYNTFNSSLNVTDSMNQATCTGELVQMVLDITKAAKNHDQINLINLIPNGCRAPVNAGSSLALELLKQNACSKFVQINNIALEAHGITDPHLFYALETPVILNQYSYTPHQN
jgi:hypothetical protein